MTRFGARLRREAIPAFVREYIAYDELKSKLRDIVAAKKQAGGGGGGPASPVSPALRSLLEARKTLFQGALDAEISKARARCADALCFYRGRAEDVTARVARTVADAHACLAGVDVGDGSGAHDTRGAREVARCIQQSMREVQGLISELTALLSYVALNMTAVRKVGGAQQARPPDARLPPEWRACILKKYAKHVEPVEALGPGFLTLEVEHPDDPGWRVVQGTFLPASVADELAAMQQHPELRAAMRDLRELYEAGRDTRTRLLERMSSNASTSSLGAGQLGAIEPALAQLDEAAVCAAQEAALVHAVPWIEGAAGMFEPPPRDEFAFATRTGLILNNLSTLLYMMNYTALLPPVDELCVHIGVSSSATGLIMAAADIAACVGAVACSAWTQLSFKAPLLAGALCSVVGGGSCFEALWWGELTWGGPLLPPLLWPLHPRPTAPPLDPPPLADYVGRAQRTAASAAFVAASNLGQSLGPFLSLPLALLPRDVTLAGLQLNRITAIGYVMAIFWLAFLAATAALFRDPPPATPIGLARAHSRTGGAPAAGTLAAPLLLHAAKEAAEDAAEEAAAHLRSPAGPLWDADAAERGVGGAAGGGLNGRGGGARGGGGGGASGAGSGGWRATIPATAACTAALFLQKAVQQAYMDGLPLFTKPLLGWSSSAAGTFLGSAGLSMVLINVAVGLLSSHASDRLLVASSTAACAAALAALTAAASSTALYFGGGLALFAASVALEGTATSLMSKVIHVGFARGVFNAGLLSTGNGVLTLVGRATGVGDRRHLAAFACWLHGGLAAACLVLLAVLGATYRHLAG
eukprot:scaffold10.g2368.t1